MKRITAIILIAVLLLGMCACGGGDASTSTAPSQQTTTTTRPADPTTVPTPSDPPTEPAKEVTVTLDSAGGECEQTRIVLTEGDCYGILPVPVLEGHVFLGWFTAAEAGEQITEDTRLISSDTHTLYAQWMVQTGFTVTLDANGGRLSAYYDRLNLEQNQTYGVLPEPIREGYDFKGWYTEPEKGTRVKSTTKFTAGEDVTLYAHWEYNAYDYWSYVLQNRVEQIPQCRRVVVYLERNASRKTYIKCPFLDDAGAINPSAALEEIRVTDEWIESVEPWIIVKLSLNMSEAMLYKMAMLKRFPNAEIYIFPTAAVSGKPESQLYYRLQLAKILYPEFFEDVDLATVKKELNISPRIYY